MTAFCKNENCPPSAELLVFEKGELGPTTSYRIQDHLATCEFCEAEVKFYTLYPTEIMSEIPTPAEIPAPLYELAEALLKHRYADAAALNDLLKEKEGLTVEAV
jgi:hypothetical protein